MIKILEYYFLKYLLGIEESLKGKISQILSINYGIKDYLNKNNLDKNLDDKIINKLLDKINNDIAIRYAKHDAFKNYKEKYGFIPPYVLMKSLSFGEISKLYGILKQNDRQSISKQFHLTDKTLKQILINLTLVRNICAHSDRLFSLKSKFKITYKNSNLETKVLSPNLRIIIDCIKIFLSEEEFKSFKNEFISELNILNNGVKSLKPNTLPNLMGFLN